MASRRFLTALIAASLMAALGVMASAAATTTGTWSQYPTGAFEYQAEIQQPINSANTSNWSAKSKGGIPVMYKLSSREGLAVFQSIGSDGFAGYLPGNFANDYAYLAFIPSPTLTFADITTLSTKYTFDSGNCHGGSLRWEIGIDMPSGPDGALNIYYGEAPNFTDCTTNNQSDVNMIGLSDLRYDTSQFNGVWYNNWTDTLALLGSGTVTYAEVVIDSGWQGLSVATDQVLTISDTTVNDNVRQWDAGGTGDFAPTCELPDAFIDVTKVDPAPSGTINEATVYPTASTDAGDQFRVIDCKYQYVLSIPKLDGLGTYDIEILIDGSEVTTIPNDEVMFDLK